MAQKSGYRLLNVTLLKSDFKRVSSIHFDNEKLQHNVNFEVNYDDGKPEMLFVTLTLKYWSGLSEDNKDVECEIVMAGAFKYSGNPDPPVEVFGKINGPAIIFPFAREHLASLTMKAGLNTVLLPPVNFTKRSEKKK